MFVLVLWFFLDAFISSFLFVALFTNFLFFLVILFGGIRLRKFSRKNFVYLFFALFLLLLLKVFWEFVKSMFSSRIR